MTVLSKGRQVEAAGPGAAVPQGGGPLGAGPNLEAAAVQDKYWWLVSGSEDI